MRHLSLLIAVSCVTLSSCAAQKERSAESTPGGPAADSPELRRRVSSLAWRLDQQTGQTEGYAREFTIHLHEPAKSLIAIGPRCIPYLTPYLNDMRTTKAWWHGRSSRYNLRVSDAVVCILRRIGGEKELELLRQRLKMYGEVIEHVEEYVNHHDTWSSKDLRWYFQLVRPARCGRSILMWAIRDIEKRVGKGKTERTDQTDAAEQ